MERCVEKLLFVFKPSPSSYFLSPKPSLLIVIVSIYLIVIGIVVTKTSSNNSSTNRSDISKTNMGVSQNEGYHFGAPYHKDYSILGSILGSPI